VEAAKALRGSFKLVTLASKNCKGDDSTAQESIKEWGHTKKSKSTNEHTKHKPRLNTQTLGPTGLYELILVAAHTHVARTHVARTLF